MTEISQAEQFLKQLKEYNNLINEDLIRIQKASQEKDTREYIIRKNKLTRNINKYSKLIKTESSIPEDERKRFKDFDVCVHSHMKFIVDIEKKIPPPPPKELPKTFEIPEKQPLLENATNEDLLQQHDQIALEINEEEKEQIVEIVEKMKGIKEAFLVLHSLVEAQQIKIDSIWENIEIASENIDEGNEQIEEAVEIQKKSSKKLLIFLSIIGIVAFIMLMIIVIALVIKFN